MMKNLYKEIIDSKKIKLIDVLNCVKDDISNYNFSIFEFDGLLSPKSTFDFNKITDSAIKNEMGYRIKDIELYKLAEGIEQTYDLILAGNLKEITKYSNNQEWRSKNDIVIEMIDCGPWEVYSTRSEIIDEIRKIAI